MRGSIERRHNNHLFQVFSVILQEFFLPPSFLTTKTISTPVASTLPLKNTANYYHWMCEVRAPLVQKNETHHQWRTGYQTQLLFSICFYSQGLLRAMVLQDLVLDVVGNEKVKLLIPGNGGGFIRDSLKVGWMGLILPSKPHCSLTVFRKPVDCPDLAFAHSCCILTLTG